MATVEFLNVDLDLESKEELTSVIDELGDNVVIMSNSHENGIYKVSLEISKCMSKPDLVLREYVSIINCLSSNALGILKKCTKITFDIGFECEGEAINTPIGINEIITTETIKLLANLNADLAITVYSVPS